MELQNTTDEEKIFRVVGRGALICRETKKYVQPSETMRAGREYSATFSVKSKKHRPTVLHPVKLAFRGGGKIKTSSYKQKWREFKAADLDAINVNFFREKERETSQTLRST